MYPSGVTRLCLSFCEKLRPKTGSTCKISFLFRRLLTRNGYLGFSISKSRKMDITIFFRRTAAFIIDLIVVVLVLSLFFIDTQTSEVILRGSELLSTNATLGEEEILLLQELSNASKKVIFLYYAVEILYQTFCVMTFSKTLGKKLFRLRVVDAQSGEKPLFVASLVRAVVRIVSQNVFYLGCLWALFSPSRRAWHDFASRTIVVGE